MNAANRLSLTTALVAGDASLADAAKLRLAQQLMEAKTLRVLAVEPTPSGRGVVVTFHIDGAFRRQDVICCAKKWRSQWRRLGAVFCC